MMKRYLLAFTCLLLCLTACRSRAPWQNPEHPHYQIEMLADPAKQYLQAEGSLYWPVTTDTLSEVTFFLHRQLEVIKLWGTHIRSFSVDSLTPAGYAWLPDAAWVHLELIRPLAPGEILEISFLYEGFIRDINPYSANALSAEWTEIGLYLPWFPQSKDMPDFTYHIRADFPETYRVSGLHEVSSTGKRWVLSSGIPVNDMVILASPNLKSMTSSSSEDIQIVFDYVSLSDTLVEHMSRDIQDIANWLSLQFGEVAVKTVHIVQSPRQAGGGYARLGGVVLGDLQESDYESYYRGYQRYFAHELAHLWWRHAPVSTWHDWINEAFAEFSALQYLRHAFGNSYYEASVEVKRKRAANLPPLWEFDRHDRSYPDAGMIIENNLYSKGPLLLADLESRTGNELFLEFCHDLLTLPSVETDQLLASLSFVVSDSVAREFKHILQSY